MPILCRLKGELFIITNPLLFPFSRRLRKWRLYAIHEVTQMLRHRSNQFKACCLRHYVASEYIRLPWTSGSLLGQLLAWIQSSNGSRSWLSSFHESDLGLRFHLYPHGNCVRNMLLLSSLYWYRNWILAKHKSKFNPQTPHPLASVVRCEFEPRLMLWVGA